MECVLIITSEDIHINSFMYEPIVDISLKELRALYSQVTQYLKLELQKTLHPNKHWSVAFSLSIQTQSLPVVSQYNHKVLY